MYCSCISKLIIHDENTQVALWHSLLYIKWFMWWSAWLSASLCLCGRLMCFDFRIICTFGCCTCHGHVLACLFDRLETQKCLVSFPVTRYWPCFNYILWIGCNNCPPPLPHTHTAQLSDYDPDKHAPGYVADFHLIPKQTHDMDDRISQLHQALAGKTSAESEFMFLSYSKR